MKHHPLPQHGGLRSPFPHSYFISPSPFSGAVLQRLGFPGTQSGGSMPHSWPPLSGEKEYLSAVNMVAQPPYLLPNKIKAAPRDKWGFQGYAFQARAFG